MIIIVKLVLCDYHDKDNHDHDNSHRCRWKEGGEVFGLADPVSSSLGGRPDDVDGHDDVDGVRRKYLRRFYL